MVRNSNSLDLQQKSVSLTAPGIFLGARRLAPICLFVAPFGIAFGIAATENGLGPIQATVMSALVFTATAQFAALDFMNDPIALFSLGLVVLALSGRHIVMGAALSRWINRLSLGQRLITLSVLSDANFADAQRSLQHGGADLGPLFGGGLALWSTWVASTALGAFGGNILGDTEAYGFGAVMLCFFAATVTGMVRASKGLILPVVVSMAVSALTLPYLPTGWNIILAALVGGTIAAIRND